MVSKSLMFGEEKPERGGELGSERAASQPSKRWITGDRVLRLAPTSVFAWLNCGVASHSSQSVLGSGALWAAIRRLTWPRESTPRDTEIVRRSGVQDRAHTSGCGGPPTSKDAGRARGGPGGAEG